MRHMRLCAVAAVRQDRLRERRSRIAQVNALEERLGLRLPNTYRQFLHRSITRSTGRHGLQLLPADEVDLIGRLNPLLTGVRFPVAELTGRRTHESAIVSPEHVQIGGDLDDCSADVCTLVPRGAQGLGWEAWVISGVDGHVIRLPAFHHLESLTRFRPA